MKKFWTITVKFLLVLALMSVALQFTAFAQGALPLDDASYIEGGIPVPPSDLSGQDIARLTAFEGLEYVKNVIGVVGLIYITITGIRLLLQSDEEENVSKAKRSLTYIIVGFVLISMSQDLAAIFDMEENPILGTPQSILQRVRLFDRQVELFVTIVKNIIGAYAVLMIVRSAGIIITHGGDEEEISNQRKTILFAIAGLLLINIGSIFINNVLYNIDKDVYTGISGTSPNLDAKEGVEQIAGVINLMVAFLAPALLLVFVIAGFMYVTSGGNEEQMNQARRIIVAGVIAVLIIFGAFALVTTVISGRLSEIGAIS